MKILYKLGSRSRPHKLIKCIENIRATAVEKDPWIILTLDEDDTATNTLPVRSLLEVFPNVYPVFGKSANKIAAFNRGIPAAGWDIIVCTSDDIEFLPNHDKRIEEDYYKAATENIYNKMDAPLRPDFVLHYNDGFPHGLILTVPIITKTYYDRFGYIYHPAYQNLWCDNEAVEVAQSMNRLVMCGDGLLIHHHPAWTGLGMDAQYKYTDSFYWSDKAIFEQRKAAGFPI